MRDVDLTARRRRARLPAARWPKPGPQSRRTSSRPSASSPQSSSSPPPAAPTPASGRSRAASQKTGLRTHRHHQHHGSHAPDHLNAMKPRIQCVLTQWIPGFMASGRRPIVMINPKLAKLTVLVVPMRLVLPSALARRPPGTCGYAPMNRSRAEIVSGSGAGSLVPILHSPDMLLTVMICSLHVTSSALELR